MLDTTRISATAQQEYPDAGDLDVEFTFDIEGEEVPRIETSWGQSRGTEVDLKAEVISIRVGNWIGDRAAAILMFGAEHIFKIEEAYADERVENWGQI